MLIETKQTIGYLLSSSLSLVAFQIGKGAAPLPTPMSLVGGGRIFFLSIRLPRYGYMLTLIE